MDQSNNNRDLDVLIVEIERNRIQMKIAWLKAEGLDGAMQSINQTLENINSKAAARKKKSG